MRVHPNGHGWMCTCRGVSERIAPTDDYVACRKSARRHSRRHCLPYTAEPGLWYRHSTLGCERGCVCTVRVRTQARPRQPCAGVRMHTARCHALHRLLRTPCSPAKCFVLPFSPRSRTVRGWGGKGTHCKWAARWAAESLLHISCMSIPPPPKMTRAGK